VKNVGGKTSWIPKGHSVSWLMLLIGTLSMLLISIDRQILPTVLPAIMKEFHLNSTMGGLISSLNFIGTFIGAAFIGIIADSIGRGYKRIFAWGGSCLLAIVSGFATFLTHSLFSLEFWRVIMGLSTGAMEPANVALVSDFWQKENRGFALGVNQTGMPIGQFVGPAVLSLILLHGSWRDAFLWIPAIGIIVILLQFVVGNKRNEQKMRTWVQKHKLTQPYTEEMISEKRSFKETLKDLTITLRNRNVLLATIIDFLFLWTEMGVATFLTLRFTNNLGLSISVAALISGASGITGWLGQIVWGTVSDALGRKFSIGIITVGFAASVIGCIFITSQITGWIILIIWGLFRNSPYAVINSIAVDSTPKQAGSSLGLLIGIGYGLSGALVSPVIGFIIDKWGWTANYIFLTISVLLVFIPLHFIHETAGTLVQDNK
jgi:MFS family permease